MSGIDHNNVDTGADQCLDTLFGAGTGANRRTDTQTAFVILTGQREIRRLLDILDRDHAAQLEIVIDHQHALDPVLMQQAQHFLPGRALLHGDQLLFRRHNRGYRLIQVRFETKVAAGDDADQVFTVNHGYTGNLVVLTQRHDFTDVLVR